MHNKAYFEHQIQNSIADIKRYDSKVQSLYKHLQSLEAKIATIQKELSELKKDGSAQHQPVTSDPSETLEKERAARLSQTLIELDKERQATEKRLSASINSLKRAISSAEDLQKEFMRQIYKANDQIRILNGKITVRHHVDDAHSWEKYGLFFKGLDDEIRVTLREIRSWEIMKNFRPKSSSGIGSFILSVLGGILGVPFGGPGIAIGAFAGWSLGKLIDQTGETGHQEMGPTVETVKAAHARSATMSSVSHHGNSLLSGHDSAPFDLSASFSNIKPFSGFGGVTMGGAHIPGINMPDPFRPMDRLESPPEIPLPTSLSSVPYSSMESPVSSIEPTLPQPIRWGALEAYLSANQNSYNNDVLFPASTLDASLMQAAQPPIGTIDTQTVGFGTIGTQTLSHLGSTFGMSDWSFRPDYDPSYASVGPSLSFFSSVPSSGLNDLYGGSSYYFGS